ncbi:MAG: CehA/McbA family metallohydrolase [Pseudomonadales bacterium]|nr:CehA/McbA family metallohydrolase [Pseudomonadales bacterium]
MQQNRDSGAGARQHAAYALQHLVSRALILIVLAVVSGMVPGQVSPAPTDTASGREPDVVLEGVLQHADHQTYRELAFELPPDISGLRVVFSHDRSAGTVIDLGLRDPERFRGWSGGNKQTFTVAENQATLSYLSGPLPAGIWHLLLGIPNIRVGVSTPYRAEIFFATGAGDREESAGAYESAAAPEEAAAIIEGARWYRGDFHAHSGHSDGVCAGPADTRGPCPIARTLEAAATRGLDFVSLTEHNTRSHTQELAALQTGSQRMLVMSGVELTTFSGHANLLGDSGPFDFPAAARNLNRTFADWRAARGLVSVNHPGLPSDERCLGCGWTASIDVRLIDAVEIVNGGVLRATASAGEPARADVRFWESLLNAGHRVTGIGGSDNHDALLAGSEPSAIGRPTTVVFARSLSAQDVFDGVRDGRVFIDVEGTRDRLIDLTAVVTASVDGSRRVRAEMGDSLCVEKGAAIDLRVRAITATDDEVLIIQDGEVLGSVALTESVDGATARYRIHHGERDGWVRVESRSSTGAARLLSNPIYLRCDRAYSPET